jgi:hypothetical protein
MPRVAADVLPLWAAKDRRDAGFEITDAVFELTAFSVTGKAGSINATLPEDENRRSVLPCIQNFTMTSQMWSHPRKVFCGNPLEVHFFIR